MKKFQNVNLTVFKANGQAAHTPEPHFQKLCPNSWKLGI